MFWEVSDVWTRVRLDLWASDAPVLHSVTGCIAFPRQFPHSTPIPIGVRADETTATGVSLVCLSPPSPVLDAEAYRPYLPLAHAKIMAVQ